MIDPTWNRRQFLAATGWGVGLGGLGLPAFARRPLPPSEQIGVGIIGVGSLGLNHHMSILMSRPEFRVVAVCDVDGDHLDAAVAKADGKVTAYRDYRKLLERSDVDAAMIVTPDHWHALIAIAACEAGKDVYCEKPLTLTIEEGRRMVEATRRYGRVFQTGSQQRSSLRFRWACELVRNGHIGELQHVQTVVGQGPVTGWETPQQPPAHLDWNFWLGPAPWAEYTPQRCHYTFRWIYDYSGGKLTDWGAHHNDIAQWGIGSELSGPVEVRAEGTFPEDGLYNTPVDFDVHMRYANGVTLHCTGAGRNGVTFTGSAGKIFVSRGTIEADPAEILDTPPGAGPIRLYESANHHENWAECIKTRERPICDVEIGHRSASVCHLANIALRTGRTLHWDPEAERFEEDEAANRLLSKPMRDPWVLV